MAWLPLAWLVLLGLWQACGAAAAAPSGAVRALARPEAYTREELLSGPLTRPLDGPASPFSSATLCRHYMSLA
jgi:hypothetical protein